MSYWLSQDRESSDLFIRWADAKRALDQAKDNEAQLLDALKTRLREKVPEGGALIGSGNTQIATWTRTNKTVVDTAGLLNADPQAFAACAKPVEVDAKKLAKDYPLLAEKFVTKVPSESYTLRLT